MIGKIVTTLLMLPLKLITVILKVILMVMPIMMPFIMPLSPAIILYIVYRVYEKEIALYFSKNIKPTVCSTVGSVPVIKNFFPYCALPDSEKVGQWELCPLEKNEQCRVKGNSCNRTRRNGHYMCCPSTFFCTPFSGGDCEAGFWYCNNSNKHNGCTGKNCDID